MPSYTPKGVCAKRIDFQIDGSGCVHDINFVQGCPGNAVGVARLAEGRPATEIIELLSDVPCGRKTTSCPVQLAKALQEYLN